MLAVYIITNNYRDYAINYLKEYLDEQLTTEIVVRKDNIHFSLFRNFPHISIWMEDVLVKSAPGPNYNQIPFPSKDTLLYAKKVSFIFNLHSLFTKKYELKKIELNEADLNILFDRAEKGNYFILKQDQYKSDKDSFSIDLKKIDLKNIRLNYVDASSKVFFKSFITDGTFSGSLSDKSVNLRVSLSGKESMLNINSKEYFADEFLKIKTDLINNQGNINLKKGNLNIFGIDIDFSGDWNKLKKSYRILVQTKSTPLHKIKNANLDKIIEKIGFHPQKGALSMQIKLSGRNKSALHIELNYLLSKAILVNEKKEIILKDVYLKGSFTNGKQSNSFTSLLIIDSLSAISDQSQIFASGGIANFNTPVVSGIIRGNIELEKISKLNGLQSRVELSGIAKSFIKFEGVLPSIHPFKASYLKNLKFYSQINFNDVFIKPIASSLPAAKVSGKIYFDSLKEINLEKISFSTGNSLFIVDGIVSNIPFLSEQKNVFLTYNCTVNSPEFHVEDLLVKDETGHKKESKIKADLPDSIIVKAIFNADKFSFGKFTASNVKGDISYLPKLLNINNFSMNSQDGKIFSEIVITQKGDFFITHCDATLQQINIRSLFESLNNFGQTIIKSENLGGKLSGHVNVIETWDQYLNPLKDQLSLQADYEIIDGEIINYQPLLGLSKFIELEELKHIRFQKLQSTITISNRTVYFSQTDIRSSATNLIGSGEHRFDNSYEYHLQVLLSDVLWAKARKKKPQNNEFGYIADDGLNRTALPLVIKGKGIEYDVSYDRKTAANNFKEKVTKEKEGLKKLFSIENPDQKLNIQTEERIEWEEDPVNSNNENGSDTQINNQKKEEEFSIQWNDD